jgi:TatD DNase family protein
VIDTHCHLADPSFAADLEAVVVRAREAGLAGALVVLAAGDQAEEAQAARALALWDRVRFAVGVHPHTAHAFAEAPETAADVVRGQWARTPAARAIGEIGLDYHYDFSPREVQQRVFRAQVRLARELRRPVVIHTREAEADTLEILREEGGGDLRGVIHCFTGTPFLARGALDLGFYVSVAGILTFPRASELREAVRGVPLDRLLTETDSPYLAPVPFRGRRNEPAHVVRVIEALAALHGLTAAAVAATTAANYEALFEP